MHRREACSGSSTSISTCPAFFKKQVPLGARLVVSRGEFAGVPALQCVFEAVAACFKLRFRISITTSPMIVFVGLFFRQLHRVPGSQQEAAIKIPNATAAQAVESFLERIPSL